MHNFTTDSHISQLIFISIFLQVFNIKLEAHQNASVSPFVIVQTLLEIFNEIPRVRKAIEANWDTITERVRMRITADGEPALIEIKPENVE